jgi:LAO/AO transport system kinase
VATCVDLVVGVVIPGAGDALQAAKRGALECVDLLWVNKADGEQTEEAERTRADYAAALTHPTNNGEGLVPICSALSALCGTGVVEAWQQLEERYAVLNERGAVQRKRQRQRCEWLEDLVRERVLAMLESSAAWREELAELEPAVATGAITPLDAANQLLSNLLDYQQK